MTEPERAKAREKFAEEFRHYFGGLVLDAATAGRTGAELALSLRHVMKGIDKKLGEAFDMLVPPTPPAKGK
jgi:hypothetical protein